jgi:hypothetical protein
MAIQQLNSFADVKAFFNNFIQTNGTDLSGSPHGAFWNTDYNSFVNGNVPGVPNVKILVIGDPANSNLIKILQGPITIGTGNQARTYPQMPADGSSYMTADQVTSVANWIQNNCPQ